MTRLRIIALTIFVALAAASTGVAGTTVYWNHRTPTYQCYGLASSAQCSLRGTPWKVFVSRRTGVAIFYGHEPQFGCNPYDTPYDCADFR